MKHVMILGGGVMQVPAIEAAHEMGWRVFLVDASGSAPGVPLADDFIEADLKHPEEVMEAARHWHAAEGLDAVFTAGTDFSLTVAQTAGALGLPGISPSAALKATDKGLMREALKQSGVNIPRFKVFTESQLENSQQFQDDVAGLASFPGYPLVVKPVDNMGARGIRRCDTPREAENALLAAVDYSRSRKVIAEEYIEGDEYSVDAIVEAGEVRITGFAKRHIFFPPWFIEMGHTLPADCDEHERALAEREFIKGIKALGIDKGAAKGDIKIQKSDEGYRAVIGEIAARLSGGYMSGWTFPYSSGLNVTAAALRIAAGEPAGLRAPLYRRTVAERAFISIPGRVSCVTVPPVGGEDIPEGVRNCFLRVAEGDRVDFPINNVEKCGNVIAVSSNPGKAQQMASDFAAQVLIRLKPDVAETENWLLRGIARRMIPVQYEANFINKFKKVFPDGYILYRYLPKNKGEERRLFFLASQELSPELDCGLDWQGQSLLDTLKRLESEGVVQSSLKASDHAGEPVPEKPFPLELFWTVLMRGSRQGIVWLADRLALEESRGSAAEWIASFEGKAE